MNVQCDVIRKSKNSDSQSWITNVSISEIRNAQREDKNISCIIRFLETSDVRPKWQDISAENLCIKALWSQWNRLSLRDGILYRKWEDDSGSRISWQLIVPDIYPDDVLSYLHDAITAGHLGVNKTLSRVKERFYWPGVGDSVKDWCRKCEQCSRRKRPYKTAKAPMKIYNVGSVMKRIALDILGPLPESERGNRYVLVVGDYFSKWIEAYAIPDQEAETVARVLVEQFITRFGVPMQIHSDQGRQFESRLFTELCKLLEIDKTRTTALHPQSDGMIERFNATIEAMLATTVQKDQKNWDELLPYLLMAYRSAEHESTKVSPNVMMFGREICLPIDILYGNVPDTANSVDNLPDYVSNIRTQLDNVHELARKHIKTASEKQKW